MTFSLEHIAIPAADPRALKNWYAAVLGATTVFDNGQNPPTYLISLGNVWLEIYTAELTQPERGNNRAAGFRHLALKVDSISGAKKELEGRGVRFTESVRPAGGAGNVLFFADGEGNLLHLVERPPGFKW
jgi:catechol 2,3-dioxygenase-like lactoylglutathione lyase family enzyme